MKILENLKKMEEGFEDEVLSPEPEASEPEASEPEASDVELSGVEGDGEIASEEGLPPFFADEEFLKELFNEIKTLVNVNIEPDTEEFAEKASSLLTSVSGIIAKHADPDHSDDEGEEVAPESEEEESGFDFDADLDEL